MQFYVPILELVGLPRVAGDLRGVVYNTSDYHPHGVLLYSGVYSVHRFRCHSTSSLVAGDGVYCRHPEHGCCLQGMQANLWNRVYLARV